MQSCREGGEDVGGPEIGARDEARATVRSVSSPGPNRPLSCKETPETPTPPFDLPYLLAFVRSACAGAGTSSCQQ